MSDDVLDTGQRVRVGVVHEVTPDGRVGVRLEPPGTRYAVVRMLSGNLWMGPEHLVGAEDRPRLGFGTCVAAGSFASCLAARRLLEEPRLPFWQW